MKTVNHSNILIIDDDTDIGNMLKMILEFKGFKAVFLEEPGKAKEVMKNESIDLLILDMFLSGSNGRDLCADLKKDPLTAGTPVIMMSAHPYAKQSCMDAGADDFLPKPFELPDMLYMINSYLHR